MEKDFTRESRLNPSVTLVLYWGEDWDGARVMKAKQYKQEGNKVNMCGAIAELIQRGRLEGIE